MHSAGSMWASTPTSECAGACGFAEDLHKICNCLPHDLSDSAAPSHLPLKGVLANSVCSQQMIGLFEVLLKMLREGVPVLTQVVAAAFEHVGAQGEGLVIFVGEAAMGGMAAGAVLLDDELVALLRAVDGVVP